ncbi:hypothetical protein ONE63_004915 [Megalurothrips usitatus]|uniref:Uncharacterized protein n=1 Tax=Megalurothrips usitatus TaxID=439358 RepID=A0AAV7X585_9NEOP|nr:hypothetical protein ONE63_004915 [Megalurothrips usitatus]
MVVTRKRAERVTAAVVCLMRRHAHALPFSPPVRRMAPPVNSQALPSRGVLAVDQRILVIASSEGGQPDHGGGRGRAGLPLSYVTPYTVTAAVPQHRRRRGAGENPGGGCCRPYLGTPAAAY